MKIQEEICRWQEKTSQRDIAVAWKHAKSPQQLYLKHKVLQSVGFFFLAGLA